MAVIDGLRRLDKAGLVMNMVLSLPKIRESFGLSFEDLERATGIGAKRLKAFEEGRQVPKWSEYLSVVFVLWMNEGFRQTVDDMGLFPDELKEAFSINRNAHAVDSL